MGLGFVTGRLPGPGRLTDHGRLAAGLIDAGLSALATFAAGLYATRRLDPATLGGYAMAYAVFVLAGWIPAGLVAAPAEVMASTAPMDRRLAIMRSSLRFGLPIATAGALITAPWVFLAPAGIAPQDIAALAITVAGAVVVSPLQDHLRRVLHLAAVPKVAVVVAVVQLAAVGLALLAWDRAGAAPAGAPFGSLIVANVASMAVGLVLIRRSLRVEPEERLTWGRIRRSGGPLSAAGLIPSAVTFLVSFIVSRLVGAATLGFIEAARVLSQPVTVVGVGLGAVLGPRITQAAAARDRIGVRHFVRRYYLLLLVVGVGYLVLFGFPLAIDPLVTFVPTAYAVPGLLAASIISWTILNLSQASRAEQLGAHRERFIARVEVEGNAARLAIAFGAPWLGAFVAPLGQACMAVIRVARYRVRLDAHYGVPATADGSVPRA